MEKEEPKENQIKTKRYRIKEEKFLRGDTSIVKRHNNYCHILTLKNQINDIIQNYFHGEVSYVYDSYDKLLRSGHDSDEMLTYWINFYEQLFDKIPPEEKVPYETKEMTEALDRGIAED